ncbi:hypothetical protein BCV72DRAFT_237110 [Rhizopus microsporus var. microsporus]|uniref:Reverse transcriptase domain-containing protein n=1 Tax=Rhizopus microsporus var. microsporus TaxID=86635 RepID=A0A1X0QMN7_RHIZD|nr:hypothetical protein BCV72DRAFT_237110 [Rhizopus microsporus var. microsporus]
MILLLAKLSIRRFSFPSEVHPSAADAALAIFNTPTIKVLAHVDDLLIFLTHSQDLLE